MNLEDLSKLADQLSSLSSNQKNNILVDAAKKGNKKTIVTIQQ